MVQIDCKIQFGGGCEQGYTDNCTMTYPSAAFWYGSYPDLPLQAGGYEGPNEGFPHIWFFPKCATKSHPTVTEWHASRIEERVVCVSSRVLPPSGTVWQTGKEGEI